MHYLSHFCIFHAWNYVRHTDALATTIRFTTNRESQIDTSYRGGIVNPTTENL